MTFSGESTGGRTQSSGDTETSVSFVPAVFPEIPHFQASFLSNDLSHTMQGLFPLFSLFRLHLCRIPAHASFPPLLPIPSLPSVSYAPFSYFLILILSRFFFHVFCSLTKDCCIFSSSRSVFMVNSVVQDQDKPHFWLIINVKQSLPLRPHRCPAPLYSELT